MNSVTKLGIDALSRLARELHVVSKECPIDLPLEYIFNNPDVSSVLEYLDTCDKYEAIYGWGWKSGLIEKKLPEADAYSQDEKEWSKPVKMIDVVSEFLQKGEISHIAILLTKHFVDSTEKNSKLLIYRFDKEKYEYFIKHSQD